jgi:hypothetical protein
MRTLSQGADAGAAGAAAVSESTSFLSASYGIAPGKIRPPTTNDGVEVIPVRVASL